MVYIMTNPPDDTTTTQQQRLQASQLPIDPVKIKAMIDYYIAEYREQLLDRDLLEQTVAKDEILWDLDISTTVTGLTTALHKSNCDPYYYRYLDEQNTIKCRRFATDLLRDLQKISKDIPGLAAKLPEIKQYVWKILDVILPDSQPTQAMRSSTLGLQRDESGTVSLQTIPADLEPHELFHQRYRECIRMGNTPDGAARLQELRESLDARTAAARDMQRMISIGHFITFSMILIHSTHILMMQATSLACARLRAFAKRWPIGTLDITLRQQHPRKIEKLADIFHQLSKNWA